MRVRVCGHEESFWVEIKPWFLFRWKKAPSIRHYLNHRTIAFYPQYHEYYDTYEKARAEASEYIRRFGKNIGVTQEITR